MAFPGHFPRFYPDDRVSRKVAAVEASGIPGKWKHDIHYKVARVQAAGIPARIDTIVGPFPAVAPAIATGIPGRVSAEITADVRAVAAEGIPGVWGVLPVFPETPTAFSVTRSSDKLTETLTWTDPPDFDHIEIWRASDYEPVEGYSLLDTVAVGVESYEDTVDAGPDYAYRIAAVSWTGDRSTRTAVAYTLGEESASLDDRTL